MLVINLSGVFPGLKIILNKVMVNKSLIFSNIIAIYGKFNMTILELWYFDCMQYKQQVLFLLM